MPELAGKAERVGGVFVFMIGAGLILDLHMLGAGGALLLIGAAIFTRGVVLARGATATRVTVEAVPDPTESHT